MSDRTELIRVRCTTEDRERWEAAAGSRNLSAWVREACDEKIGAKPDRLDQLAKLAEVQAVAAEKAAPPTEVLSLDKDEVRTFVGESVGSQERGTEGVGLGNPTVPEPQTENGTSSELQRVATVGKKSAETSPAAICSHKNLKRLPYATVCLDCGQRIR